MALVNILSRLGLKNVKLLAESLEVLGELDVAESLIDLLLSARRLTPSNANNIKQAQQWATNTLDPPHITTTPSAGIPGVRTEVPVVCCSSVQTRAMSKTYANLCTP